MTQTSRIFLSYSWANKDVADSIDNFFEDIGISFTRDIRDVKYKVNLKAYMREIRNTDFAVMLISDEFLKSYNCMYEVLELIKEKAFKAKLLQVILQNANVFTMKGRLNYIQHWEKEYKTLKKKVRKSKIENLSEIAEDLQHLKSICGNIGKFLKIISEEDSITFETLKANNYNELLEYIKIPNPVIIREAVRILKLSNKYEQDNALESFLLKYNMNKYPYFIKALILDKRDKNYESAIKNYRKTIEIDNGFAEAYNNLGVLFYNRLKDSNEAEKSFLSAIDKSIYCLAAYENLIKIYTDLNKPELSKEIEKKYIAIRNKGNIMSYRSAQNEHGEWVPVYIIKEDLIMLIKNKLPEGKGITRDDYYISKYGSLYTSEFACDWCTGAHM